MKKISLLCTCLFTLFTQAQTYTVDNKPNATANFSNLQTAIETVPAGSTLLVQGSTTSYGTLTIEKRITIKGTGYFLSENPFTQAEFSSSKVGNIAFNEGANGAIITGLDLDNNNGINLGNTSNITISNNRIGFIRGLVTTTSCLVINNFIYYRFSYYSNLGGSYSVYIGSGTTIVGNYINGFVGGDNIEVKNNICSISSDAYDLEGSAVFNNVLMKIRYSNSSQYENTIYNNIYISSGSFDNNITVETLEELFIDTTDSRYSSDGKYILKTGSVAIDAGVNGVDCGIFGGGYKLSGLPDIPNIYEFNVPTTGYTNSSGLQINIKVKSNN